MNYDKRLLILWAKNLVTVIGVIVAFFGTMYALTQLPSNVAVIIVGTAIIAYIVWFTFYMAKHKRGIEIRENERVMETLKKEDI